MDKGTNEQPDQELLCRFTESSDIVEFIDEQEKP